ncbi:MAG: hypothetical protein ABSG43_22685 [Solirubrobacteraceae bacterium]
MRWRVAAALCAALALPGCGSGSLTAAQLRNRATQVCTTADRLTATIPTPATPAASGTFLRRGLAVLEPELAALRVLKAPGDLDQVYATSIDALADKLQALTGAVRGLRAGEDPRGTITSLARRLAPLESKEDGAWRALGIPACIDQ